MAKKKRFSQYKIISSYYHYDEKFLVDLNSDLLDLGYKTIIKLPERKLKETSGQNPIYESLEGGGKDLSIQKYLNDNRDYPSILFIALSNKTTIKVLFKNANGIYIYKENDFPDIKNKEFKSGHIIHVSSEDPVYAKGMKNYLTDRFTEKSLKLDHTRRSFGIFSLILLALEMAIFFENKELFLKYRSYYPDSSLDLTLSAFAILFIYSLLVLPKAGLRIAPKERRLRLFFINIFKGKFKDNPLLVIIVGIIIYIVGQFIWSIISAQLSIK